MPPLPKAFPRKANKLSTLAPKFRASLAGSRFAAPSPPVRITLRCPGGVVEVVGAGALLPGGVVEVLQLALGGVVNEAGKFSGCLRC